MTSERQDFRLMVGPEPFDPADVEPSASAATGAQATIVQFAALLSEPDIARVTAAYGLRLDRFVPNLAYLERLDAATADRVRADFLVRAVTPFPPASKLSPDIPAAGPLDLIAVLFGDSDAGAVTAALTTIGAHDIAALDDREIGGQLHLRLTLDDAVGLTEVAAVDAIAWIEPVPTLENLDVEAAQTIQSGTVGPHAGAIWEHDLHGEDQVIGIIDAGTLNLDHCFFADAPPNVPGPGHRKVLAVFDEGGDLSNPNDPADNPPGEHFMRVAGIAAGDQLGDPGAHPHRGGAWAAKIVCRNRLDLFSKALSKPPSLRQALERSKGVTATIHNLSWSNRRTEKYETSARDVDAFSFDNEDQLVIAAGHNSGQGPANRSPAIAFNAICVAAAKAHPDHLSRASGVDGPVDGRRKPDLMAVGDGITTATSLAAPPSGPFCDMAGGIGGHTSWATPNVAAGAALVREYFQKGFYPDGTPEPHRKVDPTGALIKAVLLNSTVDMTGHPGYPSDTEGWGLIQLDRTLFFDGGGRRLWVKDVPRKAGLRLDEKRTYRVSVNDESEQLKITFVWTNRPPAQPIPNRPTVQPIRFEVEDPIGNLYLGNDFDVPNGVSRKATASPRVPPDTVNNVQMVVVNDPPFGSWTIRLRPFLNRDKQGYALVVSGGLLL
ncbi:S8 family serine peptidase [Actinomadura chokoriensis]|uniref:S8 family serine peptidase n=1 Tax=Actinomadura chokoriensis TaxID=454156 RepID=A0ABV4QYX2_9ACTN